MLVLATLRRIIACSCILVLQFSYAFSCAIKTNHSFRLFFVCVFCVHHLYQSACCGMAYRKFLCFICVHPITLYTKVRATARHIMYFSVLFVYTVYTEVRATARHIMNFSVFIVLFLCLFVYIGVPPHASMYVNRLCHSNKISVYPFGVFLIASVCLYFCCCHCS